MKLGVHVFLSLDVVGVQAPLSPSACFPPVTGVTGRIACVPLACCARSSRQGAANPSAWPEAALGCSRLGTCLGGDRLWDEVAFWAPHKSTCPGGKPSPTGPVMGSREPGQTYNSSMGSGLGSEGALCTAVPLFPV